MTEPCEKERQAYLEAMRAWEDASNYLQSFVSFDSIVPGQDRAPIPYEQYSEAIDAETAAHDKYLQKMQAYFRCRKNHKS